MFAVGVKRDFHIKFIFNKSLYIAGSSTLHRYTLKRYNKKYRLYGK